MTDCSQQRFEFQGERSRQVTAEFSGERLTSDGGLLLLRQLEGKEGIIDHFIADCFIDERQAGQVTHSLQSIVRQAARCFADFRYQTNKSWTRERRVVGKPYWYKVTSPRRSDSGR